ncbi:MAG: hypothetical protein AAF612_12555 [Planctomycetota bacterium]
MNVGEHEPLLLGSGGELVLQPSKLANVKAARANLVKICLELSGMT